jgi:nucleoside-diphosphate-sugar epimerase
LEKASAAICRKVAMAEDGGTIPMWGDGPAIRAYTYIDDMIDSTDHTDLTDRELAQRADLCYN